MKTIITVTSAATNRLLVTLDQAKVELGSTDTSEDALLEIYRARVSESIASECGREFARDTVSQQFRDVEDEEFLLLGHAFPDPRKIAGYCTISSVVQDGTTLDAADYELAPGSGKLFRLSDGVSTTWDASKVVVEFVAGYILPDDGSATLPAEISGVAVELIKAAKFNASRDPALRSEDILSGLYSYSLFDPMKAGTALPASITDVLDRYRDYVIA